MNPTLKIQKDLSHLQSNGFFLFFKFIKKISWLLQIELEKTPPISLKNGFTEMRKWKLFYLICLLIICSGKPTFICSGSKLFFSL